MAGGQVGPLLAVAVRVGVLVARRAGCSIPSINRLSNTRKTLILNLNRFPSRFQMLARLEKVLESEGRENKGVPWHLPCLRLLRLTIHQIGALPRLPILPWVQFKTWRYDEARATAVFLCGNA